MASPTLNNTATSASESPCAEGVSKNARLCFFEAGCSIILCVLRSRPFWIPLAILTLGTLVFRFTNLDLDLARLFYDTNAPKWPWPMGDQAFWVGLYDYGIYPAWILGGGGLAVWLVAFLWKKIQPIRDEGLFLAIVLFLGPGILVNVIFKPYCGRPRPHLTTEFGGKLEFKYVLTIGENLAGDCNSFPSGHASTGFYLMAPAFFLYRRHNRLALGFLILGLFAGSLIGLARMAAGGHFASDVFWAGGLVYYTGLLVALPFRFPRRGPIHF